ncbi:IucA/IucC family protein [Actinacidiphila sp. bgisy167]|uniref:IucA/IucC family protein n=1 Tax=Actinacidiphila sp. bgisy167 TaxID=3413797 RepID=UPI003D74F78B
MTVRPGEEATVAVPQQRATAAGLPDGGDLPGRADPLGRADPVGRAVPSRPPAPEPDADPVHQADPLEQADPWAAADAAGTEALLRCWVRETGRPAEPDGRTLRVPLPKSGTELLVPVRHWSAVGHHRFGAPRPTAGGAPLDAVTLAALLARETAATGPDASGLVARVADSVRQTAGFLTARRARPAAPEGTHPFLDAEQDLVLGHPLHPAPKSREGLTEAEAAVYAPESRGAFALHWLAVHRCLLATESAWTERGRPVPAARLLAALAGPELTTRLPADTVPLPLHPWQAREVAHRPGVRALLEAGLLHDLGAAGEPWHPTSSLRTVYRPGARAMLKLSLGLRITNSRRENLRKELHRGVEVHRLLRAGLAVRWHAAHPGFDIVRDPAWLAVDTASGVPVPGLDVVVRHNPFGPGDRVRCLAGLTAPRPVPDGGALRSHLAELLSRLAARTGRPMTAVATEWFLRYLDAVVRPVLWLDGEAGIALEAHQQNTLVVLDADGWPAGGRYRDNQGYYFRESARAGLTALLPGAGEKSDTFVADAVADERFAYYLGVNNVLGLVGAFGSQHLADERVLLAALRHFLARAARNGRSGLPARLLGEPLLRCKANLLTRLHGMDELAGPVATQSVYVAVPNPLTV